jgi:hypothetical protein
MYLLYPLTQFDIIIKINNGSVLPVSIKARLIFVDISTARLCFLVFVSFVFCVSLSAVFSFIYFTLCRVNRPSYISRTERQRQQRKEMEYVLKYIGIKKRRMK